MLRKVNPIIHNDLDAQPLHHLPNLRLLFLPMITAHVAQGRDARTDRTRRTALAILHGQTFARLLAQDLAGVEIDGRVGL